MMAARVGDLCTPPHTPPMLAPGVGAVTVLVGGKPAWRCNVDTHVCAMPIAPPAPAPHGPEVCYLGSLSVMIGGQMATRVGDMLVGAGGPNSIVLGAASVLIGDIGFGLANPANMAEFCADLAKLAKEWPKLTPEQRRQRLEEITNRQLAKSGVPNQSIRGSNSLTPGNAEYDFKTGTLEISQQQLNSPTFAGADARLLANAVYHEARHAEQWSLMAQRAAGQGQTAAQIQNSMGVSPAMAQSAANSPLTGTSPQGNLAQASHDSVYGPRRQYRNAVLSDAQNRYPEYRALPEEQDAWKTGDTLPCGKP
ncbi:MAG: hypothetical protein NT069_26250 [Planctomycetota bacterium]|nr:hypothetical protein [Planctomycetota bacterium]